MSVPIQKRARAVFHTFGGEDDAEYLKADQGGRPVKSKPEGGKAREEFSLLPQAPPIQ